MKLPGHIRSKIDKMFKDKTVINFEGDEPEWSIFKPQQWPLEFIEFMKQWSHKFEYYEKLRKIYYPNEQDKN
jgi:hypothetical protein|tara:strand:- start:3852 stop:4067 length:216 start_codon:yes stop_codon:yes gene_type:complete